MTLFARQQKRHRCKEQTLDSLGGGEGGINRESSTEIYILPYVKQWESAL